MVKDDIPLQELAIPRSPGARLQPAIGIMHPEGEVPEFECREAAVFAHLSWPEFSNLHWREKAKTVAHYRLHNMIEAHRSAAI